MGHTGIDPPTRTTGTHGKMCRVMIFFEISTFAFTRTQTHHRRLALFTFLRNSYVQISLRSSALPRSPQTVSSPSTVFPVEMSKSKAEKRRRQSDFKLKAADDNPTSDRRMKRKLNNQPGVGQDEQQATIGQSEEALFKIRYAAEFDDESVRSIGCQANVKHEQQDLDDTASESVQLVSTVPASPSDHAPLPPAIASFQDANSARDGVHQENVFVAILSQGSWDIKMTQMAVDDLARRAQQNAPPGHLFDQAYINGLIRLLDTTGVDAER